MSTLVPTLASGTLINQRYRLERHLGGGGVGQVYLARDTLAKDCPLALKTVEAARARPELRDALKREFEGMTRFRHPNLAAVHDLDEMGGTGVPFFTMEYVAGSDFLTGAEALSVDEVCDRLAQACRALEYLHSRKCVHRDLKPSNILVSEDEGAGSVVKLVDFGLLSGAAASPNDRTASGTPHYMAPEAFLGQAVGFEADLYSLGVVLYQLVCGALPFEGETLEALAWQHVHTPPARRAAANALIGHALWPVVERLLAKKPGDRYSSALDVIHALSRHAGIKLATDTRDTTEGYFASSPLVGREQELQRLRRHVGELTAPSAAAPCVLLEGRAGLGKSRLLEELRRHCQLEGAWMVESACPSTHATPHAPLRRILAQALALAGVERGGQADDFLGLCESAARYAGAPLPDRHGRLDPSQANTVLADLVLRFLARLAEERPLVVSVDDFQSVDSASAEIIGYVARNAEHLRLTLCLAYRPEELADSPAQGVIHELRSGRAKSVELKPLSPDHLAAMVEGTLGGVELPAGFADKLHNDTAGNPFFALELLRLYAQEGLLTRAADGWVLAEHESQATGAVPSSLQALVARRARRLPRGPLRVVELLAVFDEPVELRDLAQAMGEGQSLVSDWVDHLVVHGLAQRQTDSARVELLHREIGRTLYAGMPSIVKRALHARAGATLERRHRVQPERNVARLATHFLQAGDGIRGREYGLAAAEELRAASANAEALRFYQRVASLGPAPDVVTESRLCEGLADVHRFLGNSSEAIEWCRAGIAACQKLSDGESLFRLRRLAGSIYESTGDFDRAAEHYEAAREMLRAGAPSRHERALLHDGLGQLAIRRGHPDVALTHLRQALSALGAHRDSSTAASIYTNMAIAHQRRAESDDALWCFDKSLAIRQRLGDLEGLSRSLNNKGATHRTRAEYPQALRCYEQSLEIKMKLGNQRGRAASHYNIANVHALEGDFPRARQEYGHALEIMEGIDDRAGVASMLLGVAHASQRIGWHDDGVAALRRCVALHTELGTSAAGALCRLGGAYTEIGAYAAAEETLQQASAAAGSHPSSAAAVIYRQGRLSAARGELEQAGRALGEACGRYEELGKEELARSAKLSLAKVLTQRGQLARAEELLDGLESSSRASAAAACQVLLVKAELHRRRKQFAQALPLFRDAAKIAEAQGDPEGVWAAYLGAATLYHRNGRQASELRCCEKALLALREACSHLADPDSQRRYLRTGGREAVLEFLAAAAGHLLEALQE